MITINEFQQLNLDQQAYKLSDEGVYLQTVKKDNLTTSLYYFPRFFVEVVIDIAERKIKQITPFKNGRALEKYLESIELVLW